MPRPRSTMGAVTWGLLVLGCSINPPLRLGDLDGLSEVTELADVPFYDQQTSHCGPASLLTILEHSGVEANIEDLVERVYVPGLEGSLQVEMTATARGMGRVAYLLPPEPEAIFAEVDTGRPVLVLLNLGVPSSPRWHYAVVVGFDAAANRVLMRSGHEPRRVVGARRWLRRWDWAGRWALVLLPPGEWPARADRPRLLQALADFEEVAPVPSVERAWARVLEVWPDEPIAWLGAGNAAYALGDPARAERAYREAVSLAPESLPGRMNLALVLAATGRACEGRRQLGTPPPEDHTLAATFDEQSEDLEQRCSESGEDARESKRVLGEPEFLIDQAVLWLEALEARHRPAGRALTGAERRAFAPYFAAELLDAARVVKVPRLENPDFYRLFTEAGQPIPIDFARMSALSLVDTILVAESRVGEASLALLFHELVHVAQNRELGFERATALYVEGWLETGSYSSIPHEVQAYELARRFRAGGPPFSVAREVHRVFADSE